MPNRPRQTYAVRTFAGTRTIVQICRVASPQIAVAVKGHLPVVARTEGRALRRLARRLVPAHMRPAAVDRRRQAAVVKSIRRHRRNRPSWVKQVFSDIFRSWDSIPFG